MEKIKEKNKTAIIIQARRGSTRLPDKMNRKFYRDKTLLDIVIERIKKDNPGRLIILATTTDAKDNVLAEIALKNGIKVYRGDENDVLKRFIKAGEVYQVENIIRVCADNPFLDTRHFGTLIDLIENSRTDYISYRDKQNNPVIKTHLGLFTEAVKLKTLKNVSGKTKENTYREHVTNYIYEHANHFKIKWLDLPEYFKNTEHIRLTLDTLEDFELEKDLYQKYKHKNTKELIELLKRDKEIQEKMKLEIDKNTK